MNKKNYVHLVMFVPYGAPAGDVEILGAFSTNNLAKKCFKKNTKLDSDGDPIFYDPNEVFIERRLIQGKFA